MCSKYVQFTKTNVTKFYIITKLLKTEKQKNPKNMKSLNTGSFNA